MSDDHKQRFDDLLKRYVGNEPEPFQVKGIDLPAANPTVTLGAVHSTSSTTQKQMDAFLEAAARGEICGL